MKIIIFERFCLTFVEIIDLFTFYGVDVVIIGAITCVLTQILKTTVLKNAPNKVYAFLPVVIGTLMYFAYAMLTHLSFEYAVQNFTFLLDKGFTVGGAATIIYVICEQFVRGGSSLPTAQKVVAAIIKNCVDSQKLNDVARKIYDEFDATDLDGAAKQIANTLSESAGDADAEEFLDLAVLVANTLYKMTATAP